MNCQCDECGGTGRCQECNGSGEVYTSILCATKIPTNHPHYDELVALQNDARRVEEQAGELCRLNPSRAESYRAQCFAVRAELNKQAEKLDKRR